MGVRAVLLVAALAVLAGCTGMGISGTDSTATTATEQNVSAAFVTEENRTTVTLEVANSPDERKRGLMYRESLQRNHGMVFVYGEAASRSFWMKNTYVPLDIVFVSANGTVVNVAHADPQPNASALELRSYTSDAPAKYVVEMRQGFADRVGVGPGTEFRFENAVPQPEAEGKEGQQTEQS